jgi:serine/threonine-protein kinase
MLDSSRTESPPNLLGDATPPPGSPAGVTGRDADQTLLQTGPPPNMVDPALPQMPGFDLYVVLGKGGMGVVYKARHKTLQRLVALKMIRHAAEADFEDLKRFRNETEAVARLHHPHIVQIYEVGEHQGMPYCALEYCPGGSLHASLGGNPLPPMEAARLAEVLARAIDHAHAHDIVHRDLKPHNVLLTETGEPKVTDFGLAKKLDAEGQQTQTGVVMGTPSYMAPEQARGQAAGPPADVYALGALLYELLTARPPFKAATTMDTLLQVLQAEPVPPSQLNAKVPRDLETICLKCLQKDPGRRFTTALELAEDLRRFQAGEPIVARPVGRLERAWKWTRRHPAAAALAAALAVLVVSGAAVWYVQDRAERARAAAAARQDAEQGRMQAEQAVRAQYVNKTVEAALIDAVRPLDEIDQHLADPLKTAVLMSDPEREWKAWLTEAKKARGHAAALAGSAGEGLPTSLKTRLAVLDTRLQAGTADWKHARALDTIRLNAGELQEGKYQPARAAPHYERFFLQDLGLDFVGSNARALATQVAAHRLRYVLVAALDHWAEVLPPQATLLPTVLETARRADPDPWRDQVRDRDIWQDDSRLEKLALQADSTRHSPQVVLLLASRLDDVTRVKLLAKALIGRPRDFWLHLRMAITVEEIGEKAGHYQAALAIRPTNAVVYNELGGVLFLRGDLEGAFAACSQAIAYNAKFAGAYYNLGVTLHAKKELDRAIAAYRKAIELNRKYSNAHDSLGLALDAKGNLDGAIQAWRNAVACNGNNANAWANLGYGLRKRGSLSEAVQVLEHAAEVAPQNAAVQRELKLSQRCLELDQRLPDILAGKVKLPIPTEAVEFADFCQQPFQKRYAAAVKFYKDAFAGDPTLGVTYRYDAACAAVLLAAGHDSNTLPSSKEAAGFRELARQWLLTDLAVIRQDLQSSLSTARKKALSRLGHWMRDADLTSVRDSKALADLPDAERAAWTAFWADVEQLSNPYAKRD